MLGSFAVGKTSLVQRYVKSIFSEKYLTTVGVKIDKKEVRVAEQDMMLMLWDIYGEDELQEIRWSYLSGSSGFIFVIDGTRSSTIDTVLSLNRKIGETIGEVPSILVFNKVDISDEWEISRATIEDFSKDGWATFMTSAKTGEGVEEAFLALAEKMIGAA